MTWFDGCQNKIYAMNNNHSRSWIVHLHKHQLHQLDYHNVNIYRDFHQYFTHEDEFFE